MVTCWWMLPQINDAAKCPAVAGKVALAAMPGGHGESGGWGWGIPLNVSEQEKGAAWTFIERVQSTDVAKARALQGHAPVQTAVFEDADVLAKFPYHAAARGVVAAGKSFPIFTYTAEYENALGTELSLAASSLSLLLIVIGFPLVYAVLMSPIAVALIWRMLLQPNLGIVNESLRAIGLPGLDWLGEPSLALATMAAVDIWQQTSFVVLILAAGLASLPREPYEAAEVDGAGSVQQFFYLTLPMLRPVAAIAVVIQLINEFRTYDLPYVLTRGGPGTATEVLSYFAYRRAFLGLALNEGAAAAVVLLLIVLALCVLFFQALERQDRKRHLAPTFF